MYNFITGQFTGELCDLDHDYFNNPIRRDIIAKVNHYFKVLNVRKTHVAKTKGDVAGSGIKPAPQKGRGKARIGNKRAPHRVHGGTAHGPKLRDLTEKIPGKLRLKALKIMLSAKLYEGKLVLVDSEKLDFHKTKLLNEIAKPYQTDRLMFLTPFETDENFAKASGNLANIAFKNP